MKAAGGQFRLLPTAAAIMSESNKPARKVGVYDRPAGADRPANVRRVIYIVAVALALIATLYLLVWRTAEARFGVHSHAASRPMLSTTSNARLARATTYGPRTTSRVRPRLTAR